MELLEDLNRDYQRYRFTPRERSFLGLQGLQPVLSSNVAAVGVRNTELLIRFHNGSVYSYRGKADQYENILKSNSKGKWVWRNLRRKNAPYEKIGVIPLPDDIGVTDEDIFQEIDNRYLADLTRHVDVPVFQSFTFINGINMQKIVVGNINVYKPITDILPLAPEQPIAVEPSEVLEVNFEPASENWKANKSTSIIYDELQNTVNKTFQPPKNIINQKIDMLFKKQTKYFPEIVIKPTTTSERYQKGETIVIGKIENLDGVSKKLEMLTTVHELGHSFDTMIGKKVLGTKSSIDNISNINSTIKRFIKTSKTGSIKLPQSFIDEWVDKNFTKVIENMTPSQKKVLDAGLKFDDSIEKYISNREYRKTIRTKQTFIDLQKQVEQHKEIRKLKGDDRTTAEKNFFNENPAYEWVSDIYDAFSLGNFQANGDVVWGHGKKYYSKERTVRAEIFTELITINRVDQETYNLLKQDFPDIVNSFEEIIESSVDLLEEISG